MMDWFHSSQFRQQILRDNSGSNVRKGYKICSMTMDSDLDKSETPLLCEAEKKQIVATFPVKPKTLSEDICIETPAPKQALHGIPSLCQSLTSEKEGKARTEPRSLSMAYRQEGKSQESKKLLIDFGNSDDKDDDDDDM